MALAPGVELHLIEEGDQDGVGDQPRIRVRGVILHTNGGNVSCAGALSLMNRSDQDYHFQQETGTGKLCQYEHTDTRGDNNYRGNSFTIDGQLWGYIAIETADLGSPWERSWTDLGERRNLEDLLVWICQTHGIPARRPNDPWDFGIGYHSMWGYNVASATGEGTYGHFTTANGTRALLNNPWTNTLGKICPGPGKIREYPALLAAVAARLDGGPPPTGDDDVAWLLRCTNGTPTQNAQIFGWNGVGITWLGANQAEVVAVGKYVGQYANGAQILNNFTAAELQAMVNSSYIGPPGVTIPGFTVPPIPAALLTAALAGIGKSVTDGNTAQAAAAKATQDLIVKETDELDLAVSKIPTTGGGTGGGEAVPEYEITLSGKATRPAPA